MKNLLWIDTETTGLDESKHAIIQLAAIVDDSDGTIADEINLFIKPFKGDMISKSAMEKNQLSIADFKTEKFLDPIEALDQFKEFMKQFVNPFDKTEKFIIGGKNVNFDIKFLRKFFDKCGDNYYGSWFHYPHLEVESEFVKMMLLVDDFYLPNYKLETMCECFDIKFKAHDALEDIRATRELYYRINGE